MIPGLQQLLNKPQGFQPSVPLELATTHPYCIPTHDILHPYYIPTHYILHPYYIPTTSLDPVLWPGQWRTTVVTGNLFLTPCSEIIFLPWSMRTEVLIIFIAASQSAEAILTHINV